MKQTFAVPASADKGTFAAGWNDKCSGLEFRHKETDDWKVGWQAADEAGPVGRRPYNDTAALSNRRSFGK